jgi:hypothetical protein
VITRIWRGWTTPENADAYQRIVSQEVLPGIAARNLDGYHGAYLLRRDLGGEVEFATIMLFDTLEQVRGFAGEDYESAHVPPKARLAEDGGDLVEQQTLPLGEEGIEVVGAHGDRIDQVRTDVLIDGGGVNTDAVGQAIQVLRWRPAADDSVGARRQRGLVHHRVVDLGSMRP